MGEANTPGNLGLEVRPVPALSGGDSPHVVLENTSAHRATRIGFIGTMLLGQFTGGGQGTKVDCLKDLPVEGLCLLALKGAPHQNEHVSQALHRQALARDHTPPTLATLTTPPTAVPAHQCRWAGA